MPRRFHCYDWTTVALSASYTTRSVRSLARVNTALLLQSKRCHAAENTVLGIKRKVYQRLSWKRKENWEGKESQSKCFQSLYMPDHRPVGHSLFLSTDGSDPRIKLCFSFFFFRYEVLSDPESRAIYDESGAAGLTGGPGGMGMDDIFAQFFAQGGGGGGGPFFSFDFGGGGPGMRRSKGRDSVIPYEVTLEDLYNGKSVKMQMEKEVVCSGCKG